MVKAFGFCDLNGDPMDTNLACSPVSPMCLQVYYIVSHNTQYCFVQPAAHDMALS